MADPERRSSEPDPDEVDDRTDETSDEASDEASVEASDGRADEGGEVSEINALDGQKGDSDAPDEEPSGGSDIAQADPRAAQTGGADDVVGADDPDDDSVSAVAGTKKAEKSRGARPSAVKAKKDPDETGSASRSGNPARKAGAEKEKPTSKVSRTPAKPKRIGNRWAAPAMLAAAGIGLAWIVVFYVTQDRIDIPWYSDLGSWNLVIGMGFIVAAFGFAMKWE